MVLTLDVPMNGTYTVVSNAKAMASGNKLTVGDILTLTATPAPSYEFAMWQITSCGQTITSTNNPYFYKRN